jgi:hypothetical protein
MGAIAGGMVVFFLLGKMIEWAILKRVPVSYGIMVWASSLVGLALVFGLWFMRRDAPYAFNPAMFIDYSIAAILLPVLRTFWRKRKEAKAGSA